MTDRILAPLRDVIRRVKHGTGYVRVELGCGHAKVYRKGASPKFQARCEWCCLIGRVAKKLGK